MLRAQQFRFMRRVLSRDHRECRVGAFEDFSMASHWYASQLIVLVLGLSGAIACKLSNVYYYSAAHGKYLVQSTASYHLGFHTRFYYYLEVKVSTQTLAVKDLTQSPCDTREENSSKTVTVNYMLLVSSYSILWDQYLIISYIALSHFSTNVRRLKQNGHIWETWIRSSIFLRFSNHTFMFFERIILVNSYGYDSGYSNLPLFSNSPIKIDFKTSLSHFHLESSMKFSP